MLASLVLALLAGAALLSVLERNYTSEAVVQLDLSKRDGSFGRDQASPVVLDAGVLVQSEARLIRSRALARGVVETLGLAEHPAYAEDPVGLSRYLAKAAELGGELLAWVGGERAPAGSEPGTERERRTVRAVNAVLQRLSVGSDNRSYLVTIAYTSPDSVMSARIANAFAEEYLRRRGQAHAEAAGRMSAWLTAQIRTSAASLREAEADIAAFRRRTGLLEPGREAGADAENVRQQQLRSVTSQLSAASATRIAEERRLARVQEVLRSNSLPSATDLQALPMVQSLLEREANARRELGELLSRFGTQHPDVRRAQAGLSEVRSKISSELSRTVALLGRDLDAARQTEEELGKRLAALQGAMISGKRDETELRDRLANAQAIRERIASLREQNEQALAARNMSPSAAALVVPAEPERLPSWPRPPKVMGLALFGGLLAGVGLATAVDRRDRGLRTSGEVKSAFDVRCLGMVPEPLVEGSRGSRLGDRAVFEEAIYTVCAGANLVGPAAPECRVVLVTSSLPGEGKSALCRALADTLVASGQRVLLVSNTPARGAPAASQSAAPAPGRASGGSGDDARLLALAAPLVVERSRSFLHDAEVFGPGGLGAAVEDARKHFDVILIEGEPVMLVADALVLGRLADTVVHVARWARTKQQIVEAALRRLQEHSIVVDGVVLTRVDLARHARLRIVDECFFYMRERRYFERLARRCRRMDASPSGAG